MVGNSILEFPNLQSWVL